MALDGARDRHQARCGRGAGTGSVWSSTKICGNRWSERVVALVRYWRRTAV